MDRIAILHAIIDMRHVNFNPSEGHLLYYAGLTDRELKEEYNKLVDKL
jgi:hypothetical protein